MSSVKEQFRAVVSYLVKRADSNDLTRLQKGRLNTSVSSVVAKFLDDWDNMPESKRKTYEKDLPVK